jgi:hypothetical protein
MLCEAGCVQQLVAGQESLAALAQTVNQLAASQDQMVHQIDMLRASNQEILEKTPPPLAATVAPTQKSPTRTPAVVMGAHRKTLFNLINRGSQLNH